MSERNGAAVEDLSKEVQTDPTRYRILPLPLKALFVLFTVIGVGLGIIFILGINISGWVMINSAYYYALFALFESLAFLIMPMRAKDANRLPWYDWLLALFAFLGFLYLFANAWPISQQGWLPAPHMLGHAVALMLCLLALEGGRRMAGWPYVLICAVFYVYPIIADHMPGILWGISYSFPEVTSFIAFGSQGMVGLPGMVIGDILISFLLFAGILIACGGGKFFLDLSISLFGRFRGGPAKVAVLGSGLFGSLSGSPISNVVGTGSVTIPAMMKTGYPNYYAGAIEATASTGSVIMPPVMGSVAFIMSVLVGVDYATIIVAAAIPAFLYYFGLLMQVDAYAAHAGLRGLPKKEVPSVLSAVKNGWHLIFVLVFFVFGLLYMRWEAITPIYASGILFVLSFLHRQTKMDLKKILFMVEVIGRLIAQTIAILLPAAFILTGFTLTGVSAAFVGGIMQMSGGALVPILLLGVVASFILGMIGLGGYIFLAVTMAPALVVLGLDEISVHLFILYYSLMSLITPPVAICAFLGANIAQSKPMKTAILSTRLGIVLLFIPFFFVFNPALVLRGDSYLTSLVLLLKCIAGISVLAGGLEGYLFAVGKIRKWERPVLVAGGFAIAYPGGWAVTAGGGLLLLAVVLLNLSKLVLKKTAWKPDEPLTLENLEH
jgi:TRAP transporter 4TM/12TM fusion protein